MRSQHALLLVVSGLLLFTASGCRKPEGKKADSTAAAPAVESLTQTNESGPVKATVTLSPQKPRLGDPLTLTLTVEAKPNVTVEMPPFGEALGRFSITSFTPRSETAADGSVKHVQRYVLDAPMSGRQRIPSLRVEFTDLRPGQSASGGSDGGAETTHELLTDELAVDIASVLPDDVANGSLKQQLKGLRGPLSESVASARSLIYLIPALLALLGIGAVLLLRRMRLAARLRVRVSAYDMAMQRLHKLQRRGFPKAEEADPFYVELSDIVRRYIEDRYGVRAPELTTEEFLREARQQLRIEQRDRELLEAFLSTCDRVKFAGYRPGESESRQALEEARSFLENTRLVVAAQGTQGGQP